VTRGQVVEAANRHRVQHGRPVLVGFARAVAYVRHHKLVSEENIEWARRGYFPTPAEREARA
jgi:hypothetical protein